MKQQNNQDNPLYYSDYLHIDRLLSCQHPRSFNTEQTSPAHDEMLFIIVHQAFELWFKQSIYEIDYVRATLSKNNINDNSEEMFRIVHRLQRVVSILRHANQQFEILETMQPLDFLEFRNLLTPASGFQSKQFRLIEAKLGLKMAVRHDQEHYKNTEKHKGGFSQEDFEEIENAENHITLLQGLKNWLARMPFLHHAYWEDYIPQYTEAVHENPYFSDYAHIYYHMAPDNLAAQQDFESVFFKDGTQSGLFSAEEMRSALFIVLNRHQPLLQLPYELIRLLMEIDDLLSQWRYLHLAVVKKMIGRKVGTGGSPGAAYLSGGIQKNNIFNDLTFLATYFIERDKLPALPLSVKSRLQFN
ncbi:MAG: tryptophan 2,3-dioxygenase family protein [Saprospiraceae bacterium]